MPIAREGKLDAHEMLSTGPLDVSLNCADTSVPTYIVPEKTKESARLAVSTLAL